MGNKIDIQLTDVAGYTKKFGTLRELRDFMKREALFWKKHADALADTQTGGLHHYLDYHSRFQGAMSEFDSWDRKEVSAWDDEALQRNVNLVIGRHLSNISNTWLYSGHPFTSVYVDCHNHEQGHEIADMFIRFMTNSQVSNIKSKAAFLGAIRAYEFLHQESGIVKRRRAERQSLARLRSRLDESYSELFDDVEAFKEGFTEWDNKIREEWVECSKMAIEDHAELLRSHQTNFDSRSNEWQRNISDLEKTYEEKLRLSMPAKYWKEETSRFQSHGRIAIGALVTKLAAGVALFSWLYTKWLGGESGPLGVESIQGIVLLGTMIAAFAYLVRVCGRIAFSCFHLMRDAEEKRQLTYLYLSLSKKDRIDESSRDIVLQALFSRSESGLLGMDSSPTLPNVSDVVKSSLRVGSRS
ncbi:MAG: hypothetical protein F4229_05845 [Gammaproteobacteria bacterium]|nr:hypothetical protein [Gammaproteobacteria bacterium]